MHKVFITYSSNEEFPVVGGEIPSKVHWSRMHKQEKLKMWRDGSVRRPMNCSVHAYCALLCYAASVDDTHVALRTLVLSLTLGAHALQVYVCTIFQKQLHSRDMVCFMCMLKLIFNN